MVTKIRNVLLTILGQRLGFLASSFMSITSFPFNFGASVAQIHNGTNHRKQESNGSNAHTVPVPI